MLKIVIGTNEGKVLCISNNEDKIKASMVNYLIDTDQEPIEDFFESQNLGEYDIEVYEYHQPQLTDDQQVVLESLKHYYSKSNYYDIRAGKEPMQAVDRMLMEAESDTTGLSDVYYRLTEKQQFQVFAVFAEWGLRTLDN